MCYFCTHRARKNVIQGKKNSENLEDVEAWFVAYLVKLVRFSDSYVCVKSLKSLWQKISTNKTLINGGLDVKPAWLISMNEFKVPGSRAFEVELTPCV